MDKIYDVVIVGGGPAGYTSALYCARAGYSTLVVEKISAGGQMTATTEIDNYPGFEEGIDGSELGEKMQNGAEKYGAISEFDEVTALKLNQPIKEITTTSSLFKARTVILATGANPRKYGLAHEDELVGKGVAYCATCDGLRYKGKEVAIAGGGNSAVEEALFLSKICKKVYLIHRREVFRASNLSLQQMRSTPNIQLVLNSRIDHILYDSELTGLSILNTVDNTQTQLSCSALFVSIGRVPDTILVKGQLSLDEQGYVIADETTRTTLKGVFAVGDVRVKPLRQIVTAVSDGAVASKYVEEYLNEYGE